MRIYNHKLHRVVTNLLVNCPHIPRNINTAKVLPLAVQRVIMKHRMKRIFYEYLKPLLKLFSYYFGKLFIVFTKVLVKENGHRVLRYSIAPS